MTYMDLSYFEGTRAKTRCENKINMKIMQTIYIPLENGP